MLVTASIVSIGVCMFLHVFEIAVLIVNLSAISTLSLIRLLIDLFYLSVLNTEGLYTYRLS